MANKDYITIRINKKTLGTIFWIILVTSIVLSSIVFFHAGMMVTYYSAGEKAGYSKCINETMDNILIIDNASIQNWHYCTNEKPCYYTVSALISKGNDTPKIVNATREWFIYNGSEE